MRIRVVDYLMDKIYDAGAHHVFFVPGSGCMFLTDALAKKVELAAISVHHEQAAGMAALTYAKVNGDLGACVVTTGCGGTNAITACLHAWQDNVPCVFISGQAARNQTVRNAQVPLRQMGRQEADIISIVESITKYAVMINDPAEVEYEIDKAIYMAKSGRKGPVWLDIPLDIQGAIIETDEQHKFNIPNKPKPQASNDEINYVISELISAKRPVLLIGQGIRLADAVVELQQLVEKLGIPVVFSRLGHDILDTNSMYSMGMIGMLGASRCGNFVVQNSDFLLVIGSRLSINTTGYEYEKFARCAKIVVVDIDKDEHLKKTIRIDRFIHSDAKFFIQSLLQKDVNISIDEWLAKCSHWKSIMPLCQRQKQSNITIDMYDFVESLSDVLPNKSIVISDAGNAYYTTTSAIRTSRIKEQRSITSGALAEMGYALPASIGAYCVDKGNIIVISGDGSIMMNLQELETVSFNRFPIKIFIMNNNGYSCIRKMMDGVFRGRVIGCDSETGIGFPKFEQIAKAFDIPYARIEGGDNLSDKIANVLAKEGPIICEVMCDPDQVFLNVSTAMNSKRRIVTRPLEDQAPFMDRGEFAKEMIIPIID